MIQKNLLFFALIVGLQAPAYCMDREESFEDWDDVGAPSAVNDPYVQAMDKDDTQGLRALLSELTNATVLYDVLVKAINSSKPGMVTTVCNALNGENIHHSADAALTVALSNVVMGKVHALEIFEILLQHGAGSAQWQKTMGRLTANQAGIQAVIAKYPQNFKEKVS